VLPLVEALKSSQIQDLDHSHLILLVVRSTMDHTCARGIRELRQLKAETQQVLGIDFQADVSRFVVPIFAEIDDEPVSVGTGFLIGEGGYNFLVTAAHVLDAMQAGTRHFFYHEPGMIRDLSPMGGMMSRIPTGGTRLNDTIDINVGILEGPPLPPYPLIQREALPFSRLAVAAEPRIGKKYAFLGFPASRGKLNRIDKTYSSGMYAYLGSSSPAEVYGKLCLTQRTHIVLPFHKRGMFSLDGIQLNFPKPQGFSGSPLWELRRAEDGGRRVVGVMIESRKVPGAFIASDIGFVADAIRIAAKEGRLPTY
jgi:hypothetical protein